MQAHLDKLEPESVAQTKTAVPVFAVAADNACGITETLRVKTWAEFTTKCGDFKATDTLHVAMRSYFNNGGSFCYLIPTTKWLTEVPMLFDADLLVAAGQKILHLVSELCKPHSGLFALLDGPNEKLEDDTPLELPSTSHAAVYYPWLSFSWAETPIPPSAAMAGIYRRVDRERGFWYPPINAPLCQANPLYSITEELQSKHLSMCMFRTFKGRGTLVWGNRTLANADSDFLYINVRRTIDAIERSIQSALQKFFFHPNNSSTWQSLKARVTNYLDEIWKKGGLVGNTPEEAFFVRVGKDDTMTPDEVKQGLIRLKVGVAVARPASFISMEFTQQTQE
jgi:hypothetical protein